MDGDGGNDDGVEEVVDLTQKEVEVVECYDNEPLDCVMMRVVKQEPGLEEGQEERGEGTVAAAAAGAVGDRAGSSGVATAAAAGAVVAGAGSSTTPARVKMEVG